MYFNGLFGKIKDKNGIFMHGKVDSRMEPSKLRTIIARLEAMIEDKTSDMQVRRFTVDGVDRLEVTYDRERDLFILNDFTIEVDVQEYDNIDFIAMEIMELIQPVLPDRE